MSYENFKQKIWAKKIDRELDPVLVFADGVNKEYSGQINGLGDTVRILGVGKPSVTVHDLSQGDITLSSPEKISDTSVSLVVDKAAYYNFAVGDIDKIQGAGKVMSIHTEDAANEVANEIDLHIARLVHPDYNTIGVQAYSSSNTVITASNVMSVFDGVQQKLYENNVSPSTPVEIILPPWLYMVFRQAYQAKDTDNSEYLTNGKVGRYGNMTIKMSNNVAHKTVSSKEHYYVQVRTNRAIALAMSESHVEPYRPDTKFEDAIKGFKLYGAKIVRPKELVMLECSAN